jgi:hypothetical protein
VADFVVYLCSPAADNITGTATLIDCIITGTATPIGGDILYPNKMSSNGGDKEIEYHAKYINFIKSYVERIKHIILAWSVSF